MQILSRSDHDCKFSEEIGGKGKAVHERVSGNPAGKPPGARNRTTLAVQELLDGEAEKLTRKCVVSRRRWRAYEKRR
jgi:hypothetical protein